MYITTQTIWNINVMISLLTGSTYQPGPNTTLNEKFRSDGNWNETGVPKLDLVTIGMLPVPYLNDISNVGKMVDVKHSATDGAVYDPIPFIMRTTDNDLIPTSKVNYRLRCIEEYNGVEYICYYGKRLDQTTNITTPYHLTKLGEGDFGLEFMDTDTLNILEPVLQPSTAYTQFNVNEYVTMIRDLNLMISVNELREISDCMDIIYPGRDKVLGELAMCSSIDDGFVASSVQTNFFLSISEFIEDLISRGNPLLDTFTIGGLEMKMDRS